LIFYYYLGHKKCGERLYISLTKLCGQEKIIIPKLRSIIESLRTQEHRWVKIDWTRGIIIMYLVMQTSAWSFQALWFQPKKIISIQIDKCYTCPLGISGGSWPKLGHGHRAKMWCTFYFTYDYVCNNIWH
jgi:hypothetical protein